MVDLVPGELHACDYLCHSLLLSGGEAWVAFTPGGRGAISAPSYGDDWHSNRAGAVRLRCRIPGHSIAKGRAKANSTPQRKIASPARDRRASQAIAGPLAVPYLLQSSLRLGRPHGPIHVRICIAHHFEARVGGVSPEAVRARVERWVRDYPARFANFHGRSPVGAPGRVASGHFRRAQPCQFAHGCAPTGERLRGDFLVERNSFRFSVPLVPFERANRSAGKKRNEFRSTTGKNREVKRGPRTGGGSSRFLTRQPRWAWRPRQWQAGPPGLWHRPVAARPHWCSSARYHGLPGPSRSAGSRRSWAPVAAVPRGVPRFAASRCKAPAAWDWRSTSRGSRDGTGWPLASGRDR